MKQNVYIILIEFKLVRKIHPDRICLTYYVLIWRRLHGHSNKWMCFGVFRSRKRVYFQFV